MQKPHGLEWTESGDEGRWRGAARAQFTGLQFLLMVTLVFVGGLTALAMWSAWSWVVAFATLAGTVWIALRRPPASVLVLDASGIAREGDAPIGPLSDIERVELNHVAPMLLGAADNELVVHRRRGPAQAIALRVNDAVYLRYMAYRVNAVLPTLRAAGYRD